MKQNQIAQALNLVQVRQEYKKPVTGEEVGLMTAIENTKIRDSSVDEIKQVLRLVMIKIGLRSQNWPSDEEKMVLIEHIIKHFGGHTCEEIKLAFDMAMEGKLEETNKMGKIVLVEANCYENFSCLYFSSIMSAYRAWAKEAYRYLSQEKEPMLLEQNKKITDEEMEEWVNSWDETIKVVDNPLMIPPTFYDWLTNKGLLNLTKEQKIEYATVQAVTYRRFILAEQIKSEGEHSPLIKDLEEFDYMHNKGCFIGIEVTRLKELAKKIAVFDYLKNKENGKSEVPQSS